MKLTDLAPGHISEYATVDSAVFHAQRMAELRNMIRWKPEQLQVMKDWTDPVKREAIQAKASAEYNKELADKVLAVKAKEIPKDWKPELKTGEAYSLKPNIRRDYLKVTPVPSAKRRRTWWQNILDWLARV